MANRRAQSRRVKDVAARAGVSLGTVSNVLNRPDRVSAATRERVERAMAELGFVRNESARQLRAGKSRTLAYVMLDAAQPVLHRRGPGHRARGRGGGPLAVPLQQQQPRRARGSAPRPARAAAGPGHPGHPGGPGVADCSTRSPRRGTPVVIVDRTRGTTTSARSPSTTSWAAGWRSSTSSTAATSGSRSSAARSHSARSATGSRGPGRPGPRPACPRGPRRDRDRRPDVAEGRGPASGWPGCRRAGGRRPRSAPTTWSRSACSSRRSAPACGCPRTWRSWATTTSSSPPPPPCR